MWREGQFVIYCEENSNELQIAKIGYIEDGVNIVLATPYRYLDDKDILRVVHEDILVDLTKAISLEEREIPYIRAARGFRLRSPLEHYWIKARKNRTNKSIESLLSKESNGLSSRSISQEKIDTDFEESHNQPFLGEDILSTPSKTLLNHPFPNINMSNSSPSLSSSSSSSSAISSHAYHIIQDKGAKINLDSTQRSGAPIRSTNRIIKKTKYLHDNFIDLEKFDWRREYRLHRKSNVISNHSRNSNVLDEDYNERNELDRTKLSTVSRWETISSSPNDLENRLSKIKTYLNQDDDFDKISQSKICSLVNENQMKDSNSGGILQMNGELSGFVRKKRMNDDIFPESFASYIKYPNQYNSMRVAAPNPKFKNYKENRFILYSTKSLSSQPSSSSFDDDENTEKIYLGKIGFTEPNCISAFVHQYEFNESDKLYRHDDRNDMVIVDFKNAMLLPPNKIFYDRLSKGYRLCGTLIEIWKSRNDLPTKIVKRNSSDMNIDDCDHVDITTSVKIKSGSSTKQSSISNKKLRMGYNDDYGVKNIIPSRKRSITFIDDNDSNDKRSKHFDDGIGNHFKVDHQNVSPLRKSSILLNKRGRSFSNESRKTLKSIRHSPTSVKDVDQLSPRDLLLSAEHKSLSDSNGSENDMDSSVHSSVTKKEIFDKIDNLISKDTMSTTFTKPIIKKKVLSPKTMNFLVDKTFDSIIPDRRNDNFIKEESVDENLRINKVKDSSSESSNCIEMNVSSATPIPYVGVKLVKLAKKRYCAFIQSKGKEMVVSGLYESSIEAARAYDNAAIRHFGIDAVTNFTYEMSKSMVKSNFPISKNQNKKVIEFTNVKDHNSSSIPSHEALKHYFINMSKSYVTDVNRLSKCISKTKDMISQRQSDNMKNKLPDSHGTVWWFDKLLYEC